MRLLSILGLTRRVSFYKVKTFLKPMSNADLVARSSADNVENEMHRFIEHDEYKGRGIAVFTSGGDSQGMNAAVRAVVRVGIYLGCNVWFIREGYQGLVDGGDNIVEATWSSVSSIIHRGGTVIGSARCMEFKERAGRLKAARNLVFREITNLVVIGGDGSLTGANTFKLEWQSLLDELLHDGEINEKQKKKNQELHIVGLVGSIDNDFCGTDMTIGTDSALHRIMEAVDTITATAHSHQRTFIMEVMGRHCGYLGVVIANCAEADFVFIPEDPPDEDWPNTLCTKLAEERSIGRRSNIIVVSEGAQDKNGNPITGDMIKNVVIEKLKQDTRVTVLGHVQRGGHPSAFDRVMGCRLGVEAVIALMESKPNAPSNVVTLLGNQLVHIPLMDCVAKTKQVTEAMKNKDWTTAVKLRGTNFERNLKTYKMMVGLKPPPRRLSLDGQAMDNYTIAVVHIGVQACGMNAAVRSIVRNFITPGSTVYGIHDGIEGLVEGKFQVLEWEMVTGWTGEGGAMLGIKRTHPKKYMREIAARLKQFGIQGLIIVGGFDAYQAGLQFYNARKKYPELCIPFVVLPASTNNNMPGTNFTVGCDTALNEIMDICDRIRQATQGLKRHAFIIESMGGHCGYLATLGGIASGSDAAYIFEEDFTIEDIVRDAENMAAKMNSGIMRGILLKSDKASNNLNTEFFYRLFTEQGKDEKFTVSMNVIGQIQQGGNPSPFDRNFGIKMGARSVKYLSDQLQKHVKDGKINVNTKESAIMVGLMKRHYVFTPLEDLKAETNFDHRIPRDQWWLGLRPLARILGKHISTYGDLERKSRKWMVHSQSHFTELETLSFLDYDPSKSSIK